MYIDKQRGITLIEITIIIFIISIITVIVFTNLSGFRNDQALRNTTSEIVSLLNKAKQNTLSSVNSTNYGVHFESNKMVLFTGSNYSSSASDNEVVIFNNVVSIPSVGGLNIGGGSDVIFERLTGDTIGGTIKIQLNSNSNIYKTITITKTGSISSN